MQIIKRLLYCALIALLAVSCNENDEYLDTPAAPLVIPKKFYAQAPLPDSKTRAALECAPESWGPETRTYAVVDPLDPNEYYQYWTEGDAISLFFTTRNLKYTLHNYRNGELDYGIFELEGSATKGNDLTTGYYYSVYPYKKSTTITKAGRISYTFPDVQHYNGDSYANGENAMVAIEPLETDSILYFQNFCSYLQLRLVNDTDLTKRVRKITLTSNDSHDALTGDCSVEVTEGGEPVVRMKVTASNTLTLECGGIEVSKDKNNPSKFWFVLPGAYTFTEGFTATVVFDDHTYFQKSTSKKIAIERSHIRPMATFYPEFLKPQDPIRYKYNDTSIDEPYPFAPHVFFGEDGQALDIIDQEYDEETGEWVVHLSGTLKEITGNTFQERRPDIEYIKIDNEDEPIIIDKYAFYNCTADSLIIYNDVEKIDEEAFTGSSIKKLKIDGNVTSIEKNVASGARIENLVINGDIETIKVNAFSGNEDIRTVDINGNVTTIENGAFTGCDNLESVDIDGNVSTIGQQAFSGCRELTHISVHSVETIGYRAFYECSGLTTVDLPGIKYLNMGAFRGCTNLETIELESVITIDDNAFMDCYSLNSVVISEYCTMIGECAFCNATSLETVYCYAVLPPFIKTDNTKGSYVFDSTSEDLCIYIPLGSLDDYIDEYYFEDHEYDDPIIMAHINWWYQEYEHHIYEMGTEVEVETGTEDGADEKIGAEIE